MPGSIRFSEPIFLFLNAYWKTGYLIEFKRDFALRRELAYIGLVFAKLLILGGWKGRSCQLEMLIRSDRYGL
ncbi:hypothetical protein ASC97_30415 [Rhizobium sp. Root1203]|nr:hypothetical protein ASC97_30415 [Rhizobium sp. Root1203]